MGRRIDGGEEVDVPVATNRSWWASSSSLSGRRTRTYGTRGSSRSGRAKNARGRAADLVGG